MRQAFFVVSEIERVAAFDAEEVAVDAALVAIVAAHDFHAGITTAHAERRFAAVAAMRADGPDVIHFPRTRLIAVGPGSERAHRTNVDAHAALFAIEVVFLVGRNDGTDTAILYAERPDVHRLAADAHAAITKNAPRPIEIDHRRPLLLFLVVLGLHEFRLGGPVGESHVLQFAFAARVAHGTIQRMIAQ